MRMILTIAIAALSVTFAFGQAKNELPAADQKKISGTAESFLTAIKKNAVPEIAPLLYPGVQVRSVTQQDLKKTIDDLLVAKITAVEYIMKTTGNNISFFTRDNEQRTYALLEYKLTDEINVDEIELKDGSFTAVYFMQASLIFTESVKGSENTVKKTKRAEVEIIPYKNSYRIIGFIF